MVTSTDMLGNILKVGDEIIFHTKNTVATLILPL